MDIQPIIIQVANKNGIDPSTLIYKNLQGGTSSEIGILSVSDSPRYVIKSNNQSVIKEEVNYLNFYKEVTILPELLLVSPHFEYIVYPYIEGDSNYLRKNKAMLLRTMVLELINHYKPSQNLLGWGWSNQLKHTWAEFLLAEVKDAKQVINNVLRHQDFDMVVRLVESPRRNQAKQPYLLHGDCGVHNFIFSKGHLSGVIDPEPLIGYPLYDLVFAFCSSPDDLTLETIKSAAHELIDWEGSDEALYEEVLIGIYLRIERCILHHPNDLNEYLQAWEYWKRIVNDI